MTSKTYLLAQNKDKSNQFRFYIYAYIRSKDSTTAKAGTPYYIGKGCGGRAWYRHTYIKPPSPENIVILECNLSNIGACALERRYIEWFGRKIFKTGILVNKSDGGEGGDTTNRPIISEHRICSVCKKEFEVSYLLGTIPSTKHTCSYSCRNKLNSPKVKKPKRSKQEMLVGSSSSLEKICQCGKAFLVYHSQNETKYCSKTCAQLYRTNNHALMIKFKNIITDVVVTCTRDEFLKISLMNAVEYNFLTNGKNKIIKNWTIWDTSLNCFRSEIPKKAYTHKTIECEYCNKHVSSQNFVRWHGNKCKLFTNLF